MREIVHLALRLLAFCLAAGLLLAATNALTKGPIAYQADLTAQNAADRVPEDVISGQQPRRQHEPGFEPAAAAVAAEHKADRE